MFSPKSFSLKSFHPASWKGFEIILPPVVGKGGGGYGVERYKKQRPIAIDGDDQDDLRAEIMLQDDEILAVIMSAVTCGAVA